MKKLFIHGVALLGCAAVLGFTSCRPKNEPKPVTPKKEQIEDQKKDDSKKDSDKPEVKEYKETFKPHRIELELFEGHLHGTKDFHYLAGPEQVKHARLDQTINFIWDEASKTYKMSEEGRKRFAVQTGILYPKAEAHNPVYGLWINYYDDKGTKLNGEIGSGDKMSEYQHFFAISNVQPTATGKAEGDDNEITKMLNYTYRDTNPWEGTIKTGAKVIEDTNPIGLKGFFTFFKKRKMFDLTISLRHAYDGAKLSGGISSFYAPKQAFHKALQVTVPVIIYRTRDEQPMPDAPDTALADLDEEEQGYVRLFMDAFNTTAEEVIADCYYLINGKWEQEGPGSGRWF